MAGIVGMQVYGKRKCLGLIYANVRPYVFMVAILREFQANRTSAKRESTSNMPLLMKRSRRLMSTMSRM